MNLDESIYYTLSLKAVTGTAKGVIALTVTLNVPLTGRIILAINTHAM